MKHILCVVTRARNGPMSLSVHYRLCTGVTKDAAVVEKGDCAVGEGRNFLVMSNTKKGYYFHRGNEVAAFFWVRQEMDYWKSLVVLVGIVFPMFCQYQFLRRNQVEQVKLGDSLLDNRTRELLGDIEQLRKKDPLRLESEANTFHEAFWRRRARNITAQREHTRRVEITRGLMQSEARGTDISEWATNKKKEDEERHIARRTQDYIQGFHQHLKSKRLI